MDNIGDTLTQRVGPLPAYGWVVGGGAILAAALLLRNRGGGDAGPVTPIITGTIGGGLSPDALAGAVENARKQEQDAAKTTLERMLADAASKAQTQLSTALAAAQAQNAADLAAVRAEGAGERSALQTLIAGLREQIARLTSAATKAPAMEPPTLPPTPAPTIPNPQTGPILAPGDDRDGDGRYGGTQAPNQPGWWRAGQWWQVRDILSGFTRDTVGQLTDLPQYWIGNNRRGGDWDDQSLAKQTILPRGIDTGYGFRLPLTYDASRDTYRFDLSGRAASESSWSKFWRYMEGYGRAYPNADPQQLSILVLRRMAGDMQEAGQPLSAAGWRWEENPDILGKAYRYADHQVGGRLRSDLQLIISGLQIGKP